MARLAQWTCSLAWGCAVALAAAPACGGLAEAIASAQPKIVKLYGAGGFRGMEPYQSGMLISAEGHILTVWSYVLDTDYLVAVLDDGRRFDARLLGADPRLEIAVLKIDATELPHFELGEAVEAEPGERILALSNLFGVASGNEPASVQDGVIAAQTQLQARRGVFETPYRGPVYVLDAVTNNPGAAGGALVARDGRLLGMLGKELRNSVSGTWLNYALPIAELQLSVEQIRQGKLAAAEASGDRPRPQRAATLAVLGVQLVPDVLERTPPYVDRLAPDSPAAKAGLLPDDLVILVGDRLVQTCKEVQSELEYIDWEDPVRLTVLRNQEMVEVTLQHREGPTP